MSVVCLVVSLLVSTCVVAPARAEEAPALLDRVTVTASRHAQPVSTTAAHVTVLTRAQLAPLGAKPLDQVLATHAGVTIARTGSDGQQVSVFLRGTDSNSTLILVDGVKINPGTLGLAALQNLRASDIERIEVVRGPRSTLYGSDAIGGVISISTRRASGSSVTVSGYGGSDATADLRAQASLASERGTLAIGAGGFRTDGDRIFSGTPVTGEHDNTSGTINASTRAGAVELQAGAWLAEGRTQYLDTFTLAPLTQDFSNSVLHARATLPLASGLDASLLLGHARDDLQQLQPNFLGALDFATTERDTVGLELHQQAWAEHDLIAGVEAEREQVEALSYGLALDEANDNHAAFLRDQWTQGRHSATLGARHVNYDSFGEHWTGEASYGVEITGTTFAWLGWGNAFRAPDSSERFGFGGNPLLQPEQSDGYEAGLRQRVGTHEFSVTGFLQEIDNLIDYPAPLFTATNIARARITGTELGWDWQGKATNAGLVLTLQDPVDDGTGARLSRRPEQQLSAHVRHVVGAIGLNAELLAMDTRDNSPFDATRLPGFGVVNVGADWRWRELVLRARIDNVADKRYALASDTAGAYLMPDRAYTLGVEYRLP